MMYNKWIPKEIIIMMIIKDLISYNTIINFSTQTLSRENTTSSFERSWKMQGICSLMWKMMKIMNSRVTSSSSFYIWDNMVVLGGCYSYSVYSQSGFCLNHCRFLLEYKGVAEEMNVEYFGLFLHGFVFSWPVHHFDWYFKGFQIK